MNLYPEMNEDIRKKMQRLMYTLTKDAARTSYSKYLENLDITDDDYEQIKAIWLNKLGVKPYV